MNQKLKHFLTATFFGVALLAVPAVAQEGGHEAAPSGEAAHEKGSEHEGLAVWQWANFVLLAGLLGWMIKKNVGPMLVARSREIQEGLAAGERAKAEAQASVAAIELRLAGLEKVIAGIQAQAREEREREAARLRKATESELARTKNQVAVEIESAGKLARLELQRTAAKIAIELAEQKVKARMTPEAETTLLKSFLSDVAKSAPQVKQ